MKRKTYFLIRLDDACQTLDRSKWDRIENILDKYNIKPMVGVIPNNMDVELMKDKSDLNFWKKADNWQKKGWTVALHGYDHIHITDRGGINSVHKRSEFAGLTLKEQEKKIEKGVLILKENHLKADYFFAPSHTFDENTIKALKNKSDIRRICDTIAFKPYWKDGMLFYPQQFGQFRNINLPGYWTFCFHPNSMKSEDFLSFEMFIQLNPKKFISFQSIEVIGVKPKSCLDKVLSFLYFAMRKIR